MPGNGAIILNRTLALKLFPGQYPLGKTIRFRLDDQHFTGTFRVVGVAENTENHGIGGRSGPEYYMVRQHSADDLIFRYPDSQRISIVARGVIDARAVASELSQSVASLDPTIPVETTTLSQTVYSLAERPRFSATVLLLFAVIGSLLAAAGIYGLVSLLVSQRTQEIAIRVALGANPAALSRSMVVQVCSWIALGAAGGILCYLPAAHWVRAMLFGINPNDPATLIEATLGLLLVAILAAFVPALRAAKIDPMVALRYE